MALRQQREMERQAFGLGFGNESSDRGFNKEFEQQQNLCFLCRFHEESRRCIEKAFEDADEYDDFDSESY